MMRKLLPLAIAGALLSVNAVAAEVGGTANLAGIPVEKKVEVDTSAADKASAKGQAGLDKAAAKKDKSFGKLDKKLQGGKEQAAGIDSMTGLNTSAHVEKAETKKAGAEAHAHEAHQHATDAKAKADANVNNAPAETNKKIQGKLNKMGLGG